MHLINFNIILELSLFFGLPLFWGRVLISITSWLRSSTVDYFACQEHICCTLSFLRLLWTCMVLAVACLHAYRWCVCVCVQRKHTCWTPAQCPVTLRCSRQENLSCHVLTAWRRPFDRSSSTQKKVRTRGLWDGGGVGGFIVLYLSSYNEVRC